MVAERLTFFPHTSMTSSNCKLGECVRWGGGGGEAVGWCVVSGSGKGGQNLME